MRLSEHFRGAALVRDGEFAQLDEAASETAGSLVFCQQLDYALAAAANPNVSCILAKPELAAEVKAKGLALAADPRLEFFRLYRRLSGDGRLQPRMSFGVGAGARIHPSAVVSPKARIGEGAQIGARAVIEDYSSIGDGAVIGPGAVIGAEGLLTVREPNGELVSVPHAGGVRIGRGAMVLAGAVVAKSLFHALTEIGEGSQVGILSTIGHGARIGAGCVISGNCVVAGRVRIGDGAWLGASCSIAQGLRIGEGARVHIGSVVIRDVAAGTAVSGNFAVPHASHLRGLVKAGR